MSSYQPAPFTRVITTHSAESSTPDAKASADTDVDFHTLTGTSDFQHMSPGVAFSLVYTADSRPMVDTQHETDVKSHEKLHDSGTLGLTNSQGSVCRVVDWAPRDESETEEEGRKFMHRTESLDYGIVVFGEIELNVPGQPPKRLKAGDICVQRGTIHAWRNPSSKEPARMMFVLIAAEVKGAHGETLKGSLPPLPKEASGALGLPEGVEGTEQMLKARR